jgi:hypothetical protein
MYQKLLLSAHYYIKGHLIHYAGTQKPQRDAAQNTQDIADAIK